MPVTRAEAQELFDQAWHLARSGRDDSGNPLRADPRALAARILREFRQHHPTGTAANGRDALSAAQRAINSLAAGQALENDPLNRSAVSNRRMPYNPGIDRRRGDFEYRVVVRGSGNGTDFETVIVVRARGRLTGQEILDRAFASFRRNSDVYHNWNYRRRIDELGATPTLDGHIISAASNPGFRPGTAKP